MPILLATTWIISVQWNSTVEEVEKKKYTPNCLILARPSNSILWKYCGVPLMFLKEEKIWSSDIIFLTLFWLTNWPTLISLWNCFVSEKWTEHATAFLSIQSNAWNMYYRLAANLSSQNFSLVCTYLEGVIGISLSLLKWFLPDE